MEQPFNSGEISIPNQSLWEYISEKLNAVLKGGDRDFLTDVSTDDTIRLSELEPLSRSVASALYKRGFRPGDYLFYSTSNATRIFPVILGVWRLHGVLTNSYVDDLKDTHLARMKDTKCRFAVCDQHTSESVMGAVSQLPWDADIFSFGDVQNCMSVSQHLFADNGAECPTLGPINGDSPAFVFCTSGTTGLSKGAIHTQRTIVSMLIQDMLAPMSSFGKCFMLGRVYHITGVMTPFCFLQNGQGLLVASKINRDELLKAVRRYKPEAINGFPAFLALLDDPTIPPDDVNSVTTLLPTGGKMLAPTQERLKKRLPNLKRILQMYGSTETWYVLSAHHLSDNEQATLPPNSMGRPYPRVKCKVVDENTGKDLPSNQIGELAFSSPACMTKYLNRPKETAESVRNGWFHTGDLGYYDESGLFFMEGRKKNIFKLWNNHISPVELESILFQHPDAIDAAIVGVPVEGGDVPRAFVVKRVKSAVTEKDLRKFVDEKVASYKQLRGGVIFCEALPRTESGKTDYKALKRMSDSIPTEHLVTSGH